MSRLAARLRWRAHTPRKRRQHAPGGIYFRQEVRVMNVLVTFAVKSEFAIWQRRHKFQRLPGQWPCFEAKFGGVRVRAALTGMGRSHALATARRVLPERPDICISSGLAGALRPGLRPGQIVAARLVSEAGEPVAVASHSELLESAVECGARQVERFATASKVISSAEHKRLLGLEAEAVEMESYIILAEAARFGVPAVAIRSISDTVDFDLPYDFEEITDERGQVRISGILPQILRHPLQLPALLTFARDCRLAAARLADFLDTYMGMLDARLLPIESSLVEAR
jgi:adenosylhomocysteine nucleosidase